MHHKTKELPFARKLFCDTQGTHNLWVLSYVSNILDYGSLVNPSFPHWFSIYFLVRYRHVLMAGAKAAFDYGVDSGGVCRDRVLGFSEIFAGAELHG